MSAGFRREKHAAQILAGLNRRYEVGPNAGMKLQWEDFMTDFGRIDGQIGMKAYGVCHNFENGEMDYLCAAEVSDEGQVPNYFYALNIPERAVVIFTHNGHVETISQTWTKIFDTWLPEAKLEVAPGPQYEVYHDNFAAIEIVIPIKPTD